MALRFISFVGDSGSKRVNKEQGNKPMSPGDVVVVKGLFAKNKGSGEALGVVLREAEDGRSYMVKFIGAEDTFWEWHLLNNPETPCPTLIMLKRQESDNHSRDNDGVPIEWITSWATLATANEVPDLSKVPWLECSSGALKNIAFARDMLVAEGYVPPKATTLS
jgi:hypothetical protein